MFYNIDNTSEIIGEFPNIKLSYENIVHKKVSNYDFVLAIPEGDKHFAWFTLYKNNPVCFIMKIGTNKEILNIQIVNCCFNYQLSYGTIFYGTIFNYGDNKFFSIEDIFYYRGNNISNKIWIDKLNIFNNIMKNDIRQVAYNKSFLVFGLPIITNTIDNMNKEISYLKYNIHSIQFRSFNTKNISQFILFKNINEHSKNLQNIDIKNKTNVNNNFQKNTNTTTKSNSNIQNQNINTNQNINKPERNKYITKREIVFIVKPDIQNDIYHLYSTTDSGDESYYDIAHIPDYITSVMMNKLFRNIKENENLDKLEESDDEEEFENDKSDRFVFLDRTFNMVCAYNYKFKKWYPIRVADQKMEVINKNQLLVIENNKYK
jgi:hypothetical protein